LQILNRYSITWIKFDSKSYPGVQLQQFKLIAFLNIERHPVISF